MAGLSLLPAIIPATTYGKKAVRPNILLIVADDLGKGDVSAYGSSTVCTPHIDSLARNGVCFNNGYATSATSTPSRYGMFTGMYPWKNPNAKILPGDAPLIIGEQQPTLPRTLQQNGYATAAIGKWHLGMGKGHVDWNQPIEPCANSIGFDYSCVVAATNDRVPTVYVQNGEVMGLDPSDPIQVDYKNNFEGEPTALTHPEMLKVTWHHGHNNSIVNGIPRIGFMKGGKAALWKDDEMATFFLDQAKHFLDTIPSDKPFFLYYGLHQPHVPRVPNKKFAGKSGLGVRGDVILEADWCVGQIMDYLRRKGLLENTLVIFTSDNGAVVQDGYNDGSVVNIGAHDPHNGMRGGKYSLFDGGAHVPMFICWKDHIRPVVSDAFMSQMDFYASIAHIAGIAIPDSLDSRNYADVMLGKKKKGGRDYLILEAKMRLCYRKGDYVLIPPYIGKLRDKTGNEIGNCEDYTLYNLRKDPGQQHDLKNSEPKRLEAMKTEFHRLAGNYYSLKPNY